MVEPILRERRDARRTAHAIADRQADLIGNLRLLLAAVALVLLVLPLIVRHGAPWWGLFPVAALFLALGKWQDRVFDRRRCLHASVRFYETALDGLDEQWRSFKDDGEDLGKAWRAESSHAEDLDLFGPSSLFQLLNRTATALGRRTLAAWLAIPAGRPEVARRQEAVRELAPKLDLREALLSSAAGEDHAPVEDARLLEWAEKGRPIRFERALGVVAIAQPVLLLSALLYVFLGGVPIVLLSAILLHLVTLTLTRGVTKERVEILSGPDRSLARYARLIETIERADVTAPLLIELKARLVNSAGGEPAASSCARRLEGLVNLLDARLNMFFAMSLGPALMWDLNIVLRAERLRAVIGPKVRGWLEVIGDVEALASLAALFHDRPDYTLPAILDVEAVFRAEGLGHPLIDRRRVVPNDIALEGRGALILLSGSNMSGKSTLLRSVGINVVLARAGGPVCARALSISMLELATSVRVVDSLANGTSHFYAEIKRLKYIHDCAAKPGAVVLYLIDEMLHGTNSRERYIGASSIIRWLSQQGAMGIVTTHDLALARIEDELPPGRARNMHFADDVTDGEIRFDYRLRPGQVASTNALRLMRAVGLDLEFKE